MTTRKDQPLTDDESEDRTTDQESSTYDTEESEEEDNASP